MSSLRVRLTAMAVLVALLAIAALTIAFNVVLDHSLDSDATSRAHARAEALRTTVSVERGRLTIRDAPGDEALDQGAWVYQGERALERPAGVARDIQLAADALAGRGERVQDVSGRKFRLYAQPVVAGGDQVGTVIAGESLAAYDRTTDVALLGSGVLGLVLLGAVGALAWVVVGRALGPVTDMTRTAADWSEHDPARRFGPSERPDELGELARTFDGLLDRVSASLRHEQRLSAELSHELRTPLARIVAETELLQRRERSPDDRREALGAIARSADQMSRILETLMAAARADAGLDQGRADLAGALDRVAGEWRPLLAEQQIALVVEETNLTAGVDAEVIERVLAPMLDNARRMARKRVVLRALRREAGVSLLVSDDGPGVPREAEVHLFEPGVSNGGNGHGGAGLGLPLARRLARAVGGDVAFESTPGRPGATFRVDLPA
jgi:signal transduction histidine kinase